MGSVGDTEVTITCREHDKVLANGIRQLLAEECLIDANVTYNDTCFKVHRLILAVFLPTLKEHMNVEMSSTTASAPPSQVLSMDYVANEADDVRALVEFVYLGKLTVSRERVNHLRRLANDLNIDSLSNAIREWENVSTSSATASDGVDIVGDSMTSMEKQDEIRLEEDASVEKRSSTGNASSSDDDDDSRDGASSLGSSLTVVKVTTATRKSSRTKWKNPLLNTGRKKISVENGTRETVSRVTSTTKVAATAASKHSKSSNVSSMPTMEEREAVDRFCQQVLETWEEVKAASTEPTAEHRVVGQRRKSAKKAADLLAAMVELPTCVTCGKKFLTDRSLETHQKSCGKQQEYACKKCDVRMTQREALKQHVKKYHRNKTASKPPADVFLQCPRCKFSCNAKYKLRAHILRRHTAEREHKCPECEYSAMYKGEIERHVSRTHRNEKRFVCDICGIRYQMRGGLNRHVITKHQGIKPYKCQHCWKEYTNLHTLKLHVQTKHTHDVQRHVCDICGNTYIKRWGLQYHMRRAHGLSLEPLRKPYAPRPPPPPPPPITTLAASESGEATVVSIEVPAYLSTNPDVFPSTVEALEAMNAITMQCTADFK